MVSGDHKAHLVTNTEVGTFPASFSVALVEEDAGPFPINIVGDEAILHTEKGEGGRGRREGKGGKQRGGREREEGREGRKERMRGWEGKEGEGESRGGGKRISNRKTLNKFTCQ